MIINRYIDTQRTVLITVVDKFYRFSFFFS